MTRPKKVPQAHLERELGILRTLVALVLNGRKQGISADFSPVATESTPPITAAGSDPAKLGEAAA